MRNLLLAAVLVASVTPGFAGTPKVGQDAVELSGFNWVMNPPEIDSIKELKGEVVFIDMWGVKCGPCLALIPHVQKLQDQYGGKGLHIFAIEAQGHTPEQIIETMAKKGGKTFPVTTGVGGYDTGGGIPHGWLIGVDGKVVWEGNPGDHTFDKKLEEEMAKVRFPGLGRNEIDKDVVKAAVVPYLKGNLGGARAEAKKLAEKSEGATQTDANYVAERIGKIAERKWAKAEKLEGERRYLEASELYGWFQAAFKGEDEGTKAEEKLKGWKKDKDVQRELEAAKALQKVLASLEGRPAEEKKATLQKWAAGKKVEGTKAAEEAASMK